MLAAYLRRGMVVGLPAGLLAGLFAFFFAEQFVEGAIRLRDTVAGEHQEIFSRSTQRPHGGGMVVRGTR